MIGGREDWFPTSVWGFEHPEAGPLNASLLRFILAERDTDPCGLADRSTVLGWHSRDDLHRGAEFAPLVQFIEAGVAEAVRFQKWDVKQAAPIIASCWANVNGPGASNVVHTHPHCFLSGVYYVQARADSGAIFFLDPRPAAVMIAPPMTEFTPWTFQRVRYEPKPGRMLIFPSWLQHGVEPNRGADDRICVSFNIGLKWKD
ncbi:MAG TPA: TIGR02466 family protein [Urbifossiella sp.]|nr:TIGR02466 family protein [Urbifossiella sp.]